MRHIKLILLLAVSLLLIASCNFDDLLSSSDSDGSSDDNSLEPQTGTLKMLLTDAPAEYEAVNITFSEISVHFADGDDDSLDTEPADDDSLDTEPADDDSLDDGGSTSKIAGTWIEISGEEQTFNLLELSNGVTALLGEQELEEGRYTQIRIEITDAEVVIDSTTSHTVTIPSGTLKFVRGFDIVPGEETELVVDFDAARSINTTGKGDKMSYNLKPTIRIINKIETGAISGTVTNYENLPVAYAIAGTDTVSTSYVNKDNGKFTLGFLAEGMYDISVADTLGQTYSAPGTSVIVGSKTDLGDITLE